MIRDVINTRLAQLPVSGGVMELHVTVIDGQQWFDVIRARHNDRERQDVERWPCHTSCEITATRRFAELILKSPQ